MATEINSATAPLADALLRNSGHVIVDATLTPIELVSLARTAALWGAALTVRRAHLRTEAELTAIAIAGRGHVTFDLTTATD